MTGSFLALLLMGLATAEPAPQGVPMWMREPFFSEAGGALTSLSPVLTPPEISRRSPSLRPTLTGTSSAVKRPLSSALDRKSTRLNSSHVKISYAVFCLKKKKETDEREQIGT